MTGIASVGSDGLHMWELGSEFEHEVAACRLRELPASPVHVSRRRVASRIVVFMEYPERERKSSESDLMR
jgi:hypothetical protein